MKTKKLAHFLLPLTLLILLLALLLPGRTTIFAQPPEDRWAGVVSDENGAPLAATVTINDQSVQAEADGSFELYVPRADDDRYVINTELFGYVPLSQIHIGTAIERMQLTLKEAPEFEVDPSQAIEIEDQRGTQLSIPADSLVDADGNPATGPLQLFLYSYDLEEEAMPGDMSALDRDGQPLALESLGVFYAHFTDAEGNEYNLAQGRQAVISIPVDPSYPDPPQTIPLWSYDENRGLWLEEGEATRQRERYTGSVTHFSYWNFDVEKREPACIKLTVDPVYLAANSPIQVKAVLQSPTRVRNLSLTQTTNVLYNLPANTLVDFYMPPSASMPFATVNTGAPWGGTGVPPHPYDDCNGELHIDGSQQTGTVTGMKYHDLNGNGIKDPGEPGLEDWEITLTDANGNAITVVTDANGNYQFTNLPPGSTSVSEAQQPSWVQTYPPTVKHSFVLTPGYELENIDFGNTEPCENPTTALCTAGRADQFQTSDGSEPSQPSQELIDWASERYPYLLSEFDVIPTNRFFIHTFGESDTDTCLDGDCLIVGATLTITLQAGPSFLVWNDGIGFVQDDEVIWYSRISSLAGGSWTSGDVATITLDLTNLPAYKGVTNVLAALQDGNFDLYVQDDTGVDSIQLEVEKCCDCTPPPSDMVGWWHLDETSGPTAADIAMYPNDGTHINAPTPTSGKVDNALHFARANDYVSVPNHASLNFGAAITDTDEGDFSIDAWVYPEATQPGTEWPIVTKWANAIGYEFLIIDGRLALMLGDGSGITMYIDGTGPSIPYNAWTHLAVTVDRDDEIIFYINGTPFVSPDDPMLVSDSLVNEAPLYLGASPYSGYEYDWQYFEGIIDEVELFKRVLDPSDINAIYSAGSAGKCKCVEPPDNMVAWWHLDEMTGTLAADIAMYPNDGTHINNPTPNPGMVDGALLFNGSNQYVEVPDNSEINFGAAISDTSGDFSIDAWIRTSSNATHQIIVDKRTRTSSQYVGYSFSLYQGRLLLQLADGGWTNYWDSSSVNLADGEWHFVAATVDRDNPDGLTLYVDGFPIPTASNPFNPTGRMGDLTNNSDLRIGSRSFELSGFFNGMIDEVEIFDRVLGSDEIHAIYRAGSSGKCKCIEEEVTTLAGVEDEFSTANGTEPTYRSPGLDSYITYPFDADFDESTANHFFGQTFELTDTRTICDAWLEIRVKPLGTLDYNDTIGLNFINALGQQAIPGAGWGRYFGNGNASPGLFASEWGSSLTPVTLNLHLSALPMADGSLKNIVPILDQLRYLDVMVQDDTSVDYVKLTVAYCCDEKEPLYDFGDAPDSTNHFTPTMTTYGGTVMANFPTVFDADPAPGPKHIAPKAEAWLGEDVSLEQDADEFDDYDTINNIYPPTNMADDDGFDDGVDVDNLALPECDMADFSYTVNSVGSLSNWYVNAWFDFNQDGDWDDIYECEGPNGMYLVIDEWAVQDQAIVVSAGTGLQSFTTPSFAAIGSPQREMWMRVTLSEAQAATPTDGRGPANGFEYGETEDYLLPPREIEACDLMIEKIHNGDFVVGQTGSYSLIVTNVGSTDCDPTIQVNDLLPPGLTYVSASGSGWSCVNSGFTVTCTYGGSLAPGASTTINLTVDVDYHALPGVTNCAEVQSPDDVNLINNESCDETVVLEVEPGKIHGMKFHDLNGNGVKDPGEPGLEGWTILLMDANGNVISTVTDANGNYWFMGLPPGTYTVVEWFMLPGTLWQQTMPASGTHIVELGPGEVIENVDFGNWREGKRDYCEIHWDITYPSDDFLQTKLRVYNSSTTPQKAYDIQFMGLPAGTPYEGDVSLADGPTTFNILTALPITANANSYSPTVYYQVYYPEDFANGSPGPAMYQAIVTNLATGTSFGCTAALWPDRDWWPRPINDDIIAIPFEDTQAVGFALTNDGATAGSVDVMIEAMSDTPSPIISLDGLPAGEAVSREISLAAGETSTVTVDVMFTEYVPLGASDILFKVDIDQDGAVDAIASGLVQASHSTTISDVRITNLRDVSFSVSWLTDVPTSGEVRYGTSPSNLNQTASDDRGAATSDDTHHVTLSSLQPNTTYYFDVVSGGTTDDNAGTHYSVTTGPTLDLPGTDTIFGEVLKEDGTTHAPGTIVYITLEDADGAGSSGEAAALSALVDHSGFWSLNLGNARIEDLSAYFSYSASGDRVLLKAQGAADGVGCESVDTAADSPATEIVLNVSQCTIEWPMSLQTGWSHISLPVDPMTTPLTASDVCNDINAQGGSAVEIDRWHLGGWSGHICGEPFNDFEMVLGSDYFIKSSTASTWIIEGYEVTEAVPLTLQVGWTSIGIPHTDAYNAETLCDDIISQGVTAVEIDRWHTGGWSGHICGFPFNNFDIERGVGYFVKASSAGTITPTLPATPLRLPEELIEITPDDISTGASLPVRNLRLGNLRDTSVTLSWLTDEATTGVVYFGERAVLEQIAIDSRGAATSSTTHVVVLNNLSPETTYHFEIVSGAEVVERGTFTTLASLANIPDSDTIYGQVFYADGVTPAADTLLYLTLQDANGRGSTGEAGLLSAMVDEEGYWHANLGNARLDDGSPFSYAQSDVVVLTIASDGDNSITTLETSQLQPAPPIMLDEGPKSWELYLPLIGN